MHGIYKAEVENSEPQLTEFLKCFQGLFLCSNKHYCIELISDFFQGYLLFLTKWQLDYKFGE